uniref:Uncharacterized protein n=1 Tax=Romanomermis culicivorax TaxID=13658 RepID=A0A915HK98_ROMCU
MQIEARKKCCKAINPEVSIVCALEENNLDIAICSTVDQQFNPDVEIILMSGYCKQSKLVFNQDLWLADGTLHQTIDLVIFQICFLINSRSSI